jgi:hypothetical protein
VRMYAPSESGYIMLDAESMVGLMTVVFVKSSLKGSLRDVAVTTIKRYASQIYSCPLMLTNWLHVTGVSAAYMGTR